MRTRLLEAALRLGRRAPLALCLMSASALAAPGAMHGQGLVIDVAVDGGSRFIPIPRATVAVSAAGESATFQTDEQGRVEVPLSGLPIRPGDPVTIEVQEGFREFDVKTKVIRTTYREGGAPIIVLLESHAKGDDVRQGEYGTVALLWEYDQAVAEENMLGSVGGIPDPPTMRSVPEAFGDGLDPLLARATTFTAERFDRDNGTRRTGLYTRGMGSPEPLSEGPIQIDHDAGMKLWDRSGFDPVVRSEARGAPRAGSTPAFSFLTAATAGGGLSLLAADFDSQGELVDVAFEGLDPGFTGFFTSPPETMRREDRVSALSYDHQSERFVELDRQSGKAPSVFSAGGPGMVLDTLFGGWKTQAAPLPGDGTLIFTSRSETRRELFDFSCRSGQSTLFVSEHDAAGKRVAHHQIGGPVPTQVGHGCFPPHTQDTADFEYGESWAVAYQVGDDLRLTTRSLESGSEPATYSLGKQPRALDGIFFWKPAVLGDRDGGGFLVDIPNGATFEGSEDGERLGFPPWRIVNPVLDLSLVPTGELLTHALLPDLSGLGWLVGTFASRDLGLESGAGDLVVGEVEIPGCLDSDRIFCANHNRFSVTARYRTKGGEEGWGHARPLSNDSGTFWFFGPGNRELIVKVLPACGVNGHFWFFAAGLTDVEVQLEVWDRLTGIARLYFNPQGRAFEPILDVTAMTCGATEEARAMEAAVAQLPPSDTLPSSASPASRIATAGEDGTRCGGDPEDLCLGGGRFRVEVSYTDSGGAAVPAFGGNLTDDTGALFFFDRANVEMLIKVLNACRAFGAHWVFAAGLTDVGVEIRVTDTESGQTKTYRNPPKRAFQPITDFTTFDGCP